MCKNLVYKVLGKCIEAQTKGLGIEGLRRLQPPLHNYWGGLAPPPLLYLYRYSDKYLLSCAILRVQERLQLVQ